MKYADGYFYKMAFEHGSLWAWSGIFNHFKIGPDWLLRPTLGHPTLLRQISKYCIYQKKEKDFTKSQVENICSFLKDQYEVIKDELVLTGKGWSPKVIRQVTTDFNDRMEGTYSKHECTSCGHVHVDPEYGMETHPQNPNYVICSECSAPQRLKVEELTWQDSEFYEQEDWSVLEDVHNILNEWIDSLPEWAEAAWIEGRNLNWRGSSGHTSTSLDAESIHKALAIGSDYTLTIELMYDGTMQASCAHHDATSGFDIKPAALCCITGEALDPTEIELHSKCAKILNVFEGCEYYNYIHEDELLPATERFNLHENVWEMIEDLGVGITESQAKILNEINKEL